MPLLMHVTQHVPDLLMIGAKGLELAGERERRRARMNERPREWHHAVAQTLDEAVAMAVQRARRTVHHDRAVGLQRHELFARERALAHVEVPPRRRDAAFLDLQLRGPDRPSAPASPRPSRPGSRAQETRHPRTASQRAPAPRLPPNAARSPGRPPASRRVASPYPPCCRTRGLPAWPAAPRPTCAAKMACDTPPP